MQRILLAILLACCAPYAAASDVVESRDGSPVMARGLAAHDAGGAMLAVQSEGGDLALRRLSAAGTALWSWPGAFAATYQPLPFALRPDGSVTVASLDTSSSDWSVFRLGADGSPLGRWTHDAPTARAPVLLPDGVLLDRALEPARLAAFDHDGTLRGSYFLQASGDGIVESLGARAWPSGNITLREQHYGADYYPVFTRLIVLDRDLVRIGHFDLAGALQAERELPDGDIVAAGSVGSLARFVRISPDGAVRWEVTLAPGQSRVPRDLRLYEHAGGIGFLGRASLAGSSCVFHGTMSLDGSGAQSACEAAAGADGIAEAMDAREVAGGVQIAFRASANGEMRLVLASKQGAAPIATRLLGWDEAPDWMVVFASIGADGVYAVVEDGSVRPKSRFLRWETGPAPVVDRPIPGEDWPHWAAQTLPLPGGDVMSVAGAPGELHLVRTGPKGESRWDRALADVVAAAPVVRAAADGSVRALTRRADGVVKLTSVSAQGEIAWETTVPLAIELGSMEVDAAGDTLVSFTESAGGSCRFARFSANGVPGATASIATDGAPFGSAQLADGRTVWNCGADTLFGGLQVLDTDLGVTNVASSCPLLGARVQAIGGTRWLAAGLAHASPSTARVCVFDGVQWQRTVDLPSATISSVILRALRVDAAGDAWLTLERTLGPSQDREVSFARVTTETGEVMRWTHPVVLQQEAVMDVTPPDSRGRIAMLLLPQASGHSLRVESILPGEPAEWSVTIPVPPNFPQARLQRTTEGLLIAHAPGGTLDGVVFRVSLLRPDAVFVDGFE